MSTTSQTEFNPGMIRISRELGIRIRKALALNDNPSTSFHFFDPKDKAMGEYRAVQYALSESMRQGLIAGYIVEEIEDDVVKFKYRIVSESHWISLAVGRLESEADNERLSRCLPSIFDFI